MKTRYDDLTLTHNLSGAILPTKRNKHIYLKGAYSIPPVITLYNDTIDRGVTRTEFHQSKGEHKSRRNDRVFYKTADTACKNFIMEFFNETWYKELEDPDTFYMNVTALKFTDHLTLFCSGLHAVDAVDIEQLMKMLFTDVDGIPKFINAMEAAQRKFNPAKLVIQDQYMHDVALKLLIQSG